MPDRIFTDGGAVGLVDDDGLGIVMRQDVLSVLRPALALGEMGLGGKRRGLLVHCSGFLSLLFFLRSH
ncbi:hypothetical protein D9M72_562030 [compost metagenome]